MAAVEQWCAIKGADPEDDEQFGLAEDELTEMARNIVATGKEGTLLDSGARQFRGPRPLRPRLIVTYEERAEGNLPQLVLVKPDHEGRAGSYSRSAPKRGR